MKKFLIAFLATISIGAWAVDGTVKIVNNSTKPITDCKYTLLGQWQPAPRFGLTSGTSQYLGSFNGGNLLTFEVSCVNGPIFSASFTKTGVDKASSNCISGSCTMVFGTKTVTVTVPKHQ